MSRPLIGIPALLILACVSAGCPGKNGEEGEMLPPLPLKGIWHQVERGDTVAGLGRKYGVPAGDIAEINGLDRSVSPGPGDQIFIPGAPAPARAKAPDTGTGAQAGAGAAHEPEGRGGAGQLLWPVPGGKLHSRFGMRGKRPHEGIDISAPRGTAVVAAADGVVMYAGDGVRGYGNMIIIRHQGGQVTVYAHNHRNHVSEGVEVKAGQVIGEVGATGRASGNHLHFEVRRGETPLDPMKYVSPKQ